MRVHHGDGSGGPARWRTSEGHPCVYRRPVSLTFMPSGSILAGATLGVMTSASLAVSMIGQALAQARGLVTKHAIKQVDRLLSNRASIVWERFARWVPHLVGSRRKSSSPWTGPISTRDEQATLALNLVTGHGRATPLLWLTV